MKPIDNVVTVDKDDNEVTAIQLEKLKAKKNFIATSPIMNRHIEPIPEFYGQHFKEEALFRMGQIDLSALSDYYMNADKEKIKKEKMKKRAEKKAKR